MKSIKTTTVRTIAVGQLSVIDLHGESDSDAGGGSDGERQIVNDVEGFDNDVEVKGTGIFQENDNKNNVAEEPDTVDRPVPKKRKKHPPMKAAEQITAIAALKAKLATDFPAPPQPTKTIPFPTKVAGERAEEKSTKKVAPSIPALTSADTIEATPTPKQKRKRGPKGPRKLKHTSKAEPKAKQPRPQKRTKKEPGDRLMVGITSAVKALIEQLAKLGPSSTIKDVENVVTAAGDILDEGPNGETYNEEIEALLAQERRWKDMAEKEEEGLRENVKRFMERFGIIPMGAVEVGNSRMHADGTPAFQGSNDLKRGLT